VTFTSRIDIVEAGERCVCGTDRLLDWIQHNTDRKVGERDPTFSSFTRTSPLPPSFSVLETNQLFTTAETYNMSIASLLARQAAQRGVGAAFQTFRPPPLFLSSRCSASSLASSNASLASRLSSRIAASCVAPKALLGAQAAVASRGGLGLGLRLAVVRRAASNNLPAPKAATGTTLQRTASQHATMRLRRVAYIAGGMLPQWRYWEDGGRVGKRKLLGKRCFQIKALSCPLHGIDAAP